MWKFFKSCHSMRSFFSLVCQKLLYLSNIIKLGYWLVMWFYFLQDIADPNSVHVLFYFDSASPRWHNQLYIVNNLNSAHICKNSSRQEACLLPARMTGKGVECRLWLYPQCLSRNSSQKDWESENLNRFPDLILRRCFVEDLSAVNFFFSTSTVVL